MTDVKSKRLAGGESFETADRLHSAAIHLLRRLRVRDRESGVGPAQLSALSVLVLGGGPRSLGELAEAEQVRPPTMSRIVAGLVRSEEHTSELQSRRDLVCRLLLEKKKKKKKRTTNQNKKNNKNESQDYSVVGVL